MEESRALEPCIVKVKSEVMVEENNDLEGNRMEEAAPQPQVVVSNVKVEEHSDEEELERPAEVTVEDFKEEMQEGYYANILPAGSSAQTSVSLSRPQASLQLQWKDQHGQQILPNQIASSEQQQWVDDKGVLTISAPTVGAQWIPAETQNFADREGTIVKDSANVQYVLMTSADSFYLVESGDTNAICASDGSIKNIVTADKNIQMISLVPNQNITNSGVVIGNIAGETEVVEQSVGRQETVMIPTGSSSKRNNEPVVLSTIAPEDCDLRQTESSRKKKKTEKQNTALPNNVGGEEDESGLGIKKACDLNTCPLRCTAVFDDEERNEIYRAFQSLNPDDQKKFVMQCCTRKIYLKDLKAYDGSTKTTSHFRYDFQLRSAKGVPVQVCKLFFASTLGFSEFYFNCYLTDLYKISNSGGKVSPSTTSQCTCSGVTNSRHRGKATGKWAANCKIHSDVYSHIHRDLFHRHIESFLRTLCIQQGEHTRTIKYLPKDVTIQMMHQDFVLKHPEVVCSYELYKNFVVLFTS